MKALVGLVLAFFVGTTSYPEPVGYVNDFASLLTSEQSTTLNQELISYKDTSSIEITVVTVDSLDGKSAGAYADGLGNSWGVGEEGANNGVVFLIAPNERETHISVAGGLSTQLTDSEAQQVIDDVVIPAFKQGDFAQGIIDGTHAIINALSTDTPPAQPSSGSGVHINGAVVAWVIGVIAGVVALLFVFVRISAAVESANDQKVAMKSLPLIKEKLDVLRELTADPITPGEIRWSLDNLRDHAEAFEARMQRAKMRDWKDLSTTGQQLLAGVTKLESEAPDAIDKAEVAKKHILATKDATIESIRSDIQECVRILKNPHIVLTNTTSSWHRDIGPGRHRSMRQSIARMLSWETDPKDLSREIDAFLDHLKDENPDWVVLQQELHEIKGSAAETKKKLLGKEKDLGEIPERLETLKRNATSEVERTRISEAQQEISSGISPFVVYAALNAYLNPAPSRHNSDSDSYHSSSSSDTHSSSSGYDSSGGGFGDSGGFGGGGGFDGGGGGGSW